VENYEKPRKHHIHRLYHKNRKISTYFYGKRRVWKKKKSDKWKRVLTNEGKFIIIVWNRYLFE